MNRLRGYNWVPGLRKYAAWKVIGLLLCNLNVLSSQDTLHLSPLHCSIDLTLGLAVCNSPIAEVNSQGAVQIITLLEETYEVLTPPSEFALGTAYRLLDKDGEEVVLYFSGLPLLNIRTGEVIVDEPRVFAELSLQSMDGELVESTIGIEYKGGWTQSLEKKSFRIELWADNTGQETSKESLLGMRSDDDWNLEAMFNEPLRLRNVTNAYLWKDLHRPYYLDDEPEAKTSIELEYVELFLNDQYQGVYALSERIDRKQLQLKKPDTDTRGELFKAYSWGAPTFGSLPDFDNGSETWEGFEQVYPVEKIEWEGLYDFVDFVINASHDVFYEDWDEWFQRGNAIDYFIFLNAIRALDNTGKNIYIARYNSEEPFFYVPFDLDGTYGVVWNGQIDDASSGILSNGFYDRLLTDCNAAGFSTELKQRWQSLRQGLLSNDQLKERGESRHSYLNANGVYEREEMAWSSYNYDIGNIDQFTKWIDKRMQLLDSYFAELCEDVSVENVYNKQFQIAEAGGGRFLLLNANENRNYSCKVYSNNGHLLLTSKNDPLLDLSNCPAGFYIIAIEYRGKQEFHKLIVRT